MWRIPYAPPKRSRRSNAFGWDESNLENDENVGPDTSIQNGGKTDARHLQESSNAWISPNSWKLDAFDNKLKPHERKAEWRRFRDQFQWNLECRNPPNGEAKLRFLRIHAGEYLLKVIKMQEALLLSKEVVDVYEEVIKLLDNYFDSLCDKTQERIKFRKMEQNAEESFNDWVLRLECQSKFCEFEGELRNEEFLQALIGNSVPELAEKLYEASSFFHNDINKMIQHGQHLDLMRFQKLETAKPLTISAEASTSEENTKPVMYVDKRGSSKNHDVKRYEPYSRSSAGSRKECPKCGRYHAMNRCPAYRSKCGRCGRVGHWVARCNMKDQEKDSGDDRKDAVLKHIARINKV